MEESEQAHDRNERNPERIRKFIPGLLNSQPHRVQILDKLFRSRGFFDLGDLLRRSGNAESLLEAASEEDLKTEVRGDLKKAYLKMAVPPGVNPLDLLRVVQRNENPGKLRLPRKPLSLELGSVYGSEYLVIRTLYNNGKGRIQCFTREGDAAIQYLLCSETSAA